MTASSRRLFMTKAAVAYATAVFAPGVATLAWASQATPQEHHIEIKRFKFHPEKLEIKPGDTIIWTNRDIVPHTASATDKSWDTGKLKRGESKSILVTADMSVDYFCRYHPKMKASLNLIVKK